MKATKKLIPALAMLLVSAVVMSSASFAWFTMSRQVTAQGMNVTVTAPNNLLIKATNTEDEYAELSTRRAQNVVLVPASTNSAGKGDIYSVKDGEALHASNGKLFMQDPDGKQTKLQTATEAKDAKEAQDATPGGYYDFKYTIKSEGGQNVNVVVKDITIKNVDNNGKSLNPVRVAVMSVDGESETMIKMFKPVDGAVNHDGKVVDSIVDGVPTLVPDTVYNEYAKNSSDNNDNKFVVAKLSSTNAEQNIIIRVWYEGQDEACTVALGAGAAFNIEVVLADVASLPAQAQ